MLNTRESTGKVVRVVRFTKCTPIYGTVSTKYNTYVHPYYLIFTVKPYRFLTGSLPVAQNLTGFRSTGKVSGKVLTGIAYPYIRHYNQNNATPPTSTGIKWTKIKPYRSYRLNKTYRVRSVFFRRNCED